MTVIDYLIIIFAIIAIVSIVLLFLYLNNQIEESDLYKNISKKENKKNKNMFN